MDYTNYTVEDLASDHSFIQWANKRDQAAIIFWDNFILKYPEMRVKVAQARALVLNLRQAESMKQSEHQISIIWNAIDQRIDLEGEMSNRRMKQGWSVSYALAVLSGIIFISLGSWYILKPQIAGQAASTSDSSAPESDFIEEVNTSGSVLRVHLSDGSAIALENNSRLRYKKNFSDDSLRVVYLKGEAFFEVAKNPGRPFMVHANDVVTRVLGTSFRVKAPDDQADVVVSVKTGKVSVYTESAISRSHNQKNAVILLPNQQVTYIRKEDVFGKELISDPEILLPSVKTKDFVFENAPVREVFKTLQKAYGIEIIFDEEIMNNCYFTAPLGSEPLFEKLKIICRTIGARYETIDAKVVITSTGC